MTDPDQIHTLERVTRLWHRRVRSGPRTVAAGLAVVAAVAMIGWLLWPGPRTTDAQGLSKTAFMTGQQGPTRPAGQANLPVVPGRHDRIHRDFFRLESGSGPLPTMEQGGDPEETTADFSVPSPQEVLEDSVRVRAIMVGARPQAWIGDVLVSVGEKVKLIAQGGNDDEWLVTAIDGQRVSLTRGGEVIVLHLESEEEGQPGGQGGLGEP
jgi:hypothetical protein